ncbi:MAG: GNAT family N-acetyltransferase [Candidatus Eisenbacteria bacterium]|uniref:GNAT family N-acetyltransferase n=1 Tax=Eiseniibacteriota bacterium TaxID=2212470 RepID=A0A538TNA6_UNCEI|nr:MAG: GNAT family N-acetyltransferase [Candidatus Eisenbacteria bacterium]
MDISPLGEHPPKPSCRLGARGLPPIHHPCEPMINIRPAVKSDEAALGRLGAALMRQHHASDPRRFILTDRPEAGYGRFLVSQLTDPDYVVLVAEHSSEIVGYVFAGIEPTSWRDLRGPCGFIHDVYVHERARRQGTGRELVNAAIAWVQSKGMSQVVLWSKSGNDAAQRLFGKRGFRETMIEMTLDREPSEPRD